MGSCQRNAQAIVVKSGSTAHQCSRSPVTVRTVTNFGEHACPIKGQRKNGPPPFTYGVRCAQRVLTDSLDEWRQDMPVPVHLRLFQNQRIARPSAPPNAPKALLGSSPLTVFSFFNPNSRKQTYPRSLISRRARTRSLSVPQMRQTSSSLESGCVSA
jgi:hypothetical protein